MGPSLHKLQRLIYFVFKLLTTSNGCGNEAFIGTLRISKNYSTFQRLFLASLWATGTLPSILHVLFIL